MSPASITVNARTYRWPARPVVIVCVDGCEPEYINQAIATGRAPFLAALRETGTCLTADCVVPSFTNPNNLSIVTGATPAVHGICGNYFWDREAGAEVMMNDPKYLRAGTILAALAGAGAKVAVVTAKDKLRALLGHRMAGICFSSEKAGEATHDGQRHRRRAGDGRNAGAIRLQRGALRIRVRGRRQRCSSGSDPTSCICRRPITSSTRRLPASAPPTSSMRCWIGISPRWTRWARTIVVTADHGMNAKTDAFGRPNIVFLQDILDHAYPAGATRVILPITDPYVVHHGALGSFATVYLSATVAVADAAARIAALPGIDIVLPRAEACARFELPEDRVGDLVVVAERLTVIGTSRDRHDLSGLDAPLRSHGGVSEQQVPLIANRVAAALPPGRRWRNFDAFDLALNHLQ